MGNETKIEQIKSQLITLTPKEKKSLISYLRSSYSVFEDFTEVVCCPHCKSTKIVKNGTRNGHHKYICRNEYCKKTFTYRTKTILSGIQKLNQWNMFLEDFMSLNITPVRQLKDKIGVSEQTIFNWRHKLLAVLAKKDCVFKEEVVEFDEANFMISRKGRQQMNIPDMSAYRHWRRNQPGESDYKVKMFIAYGRATGQLELYRSNMGRTRKTDMQEYFTNSKFNDVTVYCDAHHTYKGFFRDKGIQFQSFISRHHVDPNNPHLHNQNVNGYIKNFKDFVNRYLKGVSTKYLNQYIKWYQFIHDIRLHIASDVRTGLKHRFDFAENICREVVGDDEGLGMYRNTEIAFVEYLHKNGRSNFGVCKNHYYNWTPVKTQALIIPPKK